MRVAVVTVSKGSHVRVYVEHLIAAGHKVTVLTNGRDYFDLPVRVVDLRPLAGRRFRLPQATLDRMRAKRLIRELTEGGYDVVNCQMVMLDALDVLRESPVPVVLSFHGSDIHRRDELPARFATELPALLPRATTIHAVSQHMAEELVSLGAPAEKIEVFQYGIDTEMFSPGEEAPRPHRIVCSRSLKPLYRTHLVIEAMPQVLARYPEAELAIYGEGPEESRLHGLASELGLGDSVTFLGVQRSEVIARDLATCAVWASMAESDGTPLSLLEAMAAGAVPVVADLPTLREWIEPGGGVLVEPDADAVAQGLIDGIALSDAGSHAGKNRAMVVERADRSVNLPRYERMLERAAEQQR